MLLIHYQQEDVLLITFRSGSSVQGGRAQPKVLEIDAEICALHAIRQALPRLIGAFPGGSPVTECPILEARDGAEEQGWRAKVIYDLDCPNIAAAERAGLRRPWQEWDRSKSSDRPVPGATARIVVPGGWPQCAAVDTAEGKAALY